MNWGLVLSIGAYTGLLLGCSNKDVRIVRQAPTSNFEAGFLVKANPATFQEFLKNSSVSYRVLDQTHNLYEIFIESAGDLKNFDFEEIEKNTVFRVQKWRPTSGDECDGSVTPPAISIKSNIPSDTVISVDEKNSLTIDASQTSPNPLSHGPLQFEWTIQSPNGNQQKNETQVHVDLNEIGNYRASLKVTDGDKNCAVQTFKVAITGNPQFSPVDIIPELPKNLLKQSKSMKLDEIHQLSTGEKIVVAVVDSGINYNHVDLSTQIALNPNESVDSIDSDKNGFVDDFMGWDFVNSDPFPFDDLGHGTFVSGLISGKRFGLASSTKILPLKVISALDTSDVGSIVAAIYYAVDRGAQIINLSISKRDGEFKTLKRAFDFAKEHNVLIVSAAGNDATEISEKAGRYFPSLLKSPQHINVAALEKGRRLANYSNYSPEFVELGAFGGIKKHPLLSAGPHPTTFVAGSGTSAATALVSGTAALVWSLNLAFSAEQIKASMIGKSDAKENLKSVIKDGRVLSPLDLLKEIH